MLANWKFVFYALSAVAIVLLAIRHLRKQRKHDSQKLQSFSNDQSAGIATGSVDLTPPASAPIAAAAVPTNVQTAPAAVTPPPLPQEPLYSVGRESRAHRGESWTDRSLFHANGVAYEDNPVPAVEAHEVPAHGTTDRVFGGATPFFAAALPESGQRLHDAKRELRSAGYYQPHALENLTAVRYVLMMGALVLFGVLLLLVPSRMEGPVLFLLAAGVVAGWSLPRLYVRAKATQRLSEIERAMPDMLDMLNMSVSQGMTVQESLGRVGRQLESVSPALSQELKIVSDQARIGSLDQALQNFSDRIDLPEVHSFTSLMNQTERMGTSVSQALATYSDTMRDNLRQRADEKANRAAFRLLFPTVLFLMPAVFIFLLGPAIVELSDFYNGTGRQYLTRNRQNVDGFNDARDNNRGR